jgi:hypothetical protein
MARPLPNASHHGIHDLQRQPPLVTKWPRATKPPERRNDDCDQAARFAVSAGGKEAAAPQVTNRSGRRCPKVRTFSLLVEFLTATSTLTTPPLLVRSSAAASYNTKSRRKFGICSKVLRKYLRSWLMPA